MNKMNKKFFLKNLLLVSLPLLLVTIMLGSLSIVITDSYVKKEINNNNNILIKQNKENIELLLNEINNVYLTFGTNPDVTLSLKRILNVTSYGFEDSWQLNTIGSLLNATSYSKPYIESIYVYFNNDHKNFLATSQGLTDVDRYYDKSWYNSYIKSNNDNSLWTEVRMIKPYDFQSQSIKVLTVYKKINSIRNKNDGVVVLNIRMDYIENLFNSLITVPGQKIFMLDDKNNIICQNTGNKIANKVNINQFKKTNIVSELNSVQYNIRYLSVIPQKYLYSVPEMLLKITLFLLAFCLLMGLSITYYITKRNYKNLKHIIDIIDSSKSSIPLTPLPEEDKDEYSYIANNILKNFFDEKYLKIQLSEKKYRLQAMELLALQSQISPHFLFNTLETIYLKTLALTKKPNEVNDMIGNLSQILKYSLSDPSETITLKNEIENTKCYISIQKIRYKDKFDVIWQYDDQSLTHNVMKLLFQPLIENSIYHGINENKKKIRIKIKIRLDDNHMKITVVDNGIGISQEKLYLLREQLNKDFDYTSHIGLMNINGRLKSIYDNQSILIIRSKLGVGTAIYITFPCDYRRKFSEEV